jgi:rhodanese-related sulfurtransferase
MSQNTPEIDIEKLARSGEEGATVIDVREPGEYVAGHIPGATPVPMGHLPSRLGELDRGRPVYVVCASGNRSAAMTDVLVASGFEAYSVAGGTSAWARSGRPVETGGPGRA